MKIEPFDLVECIQASGFMASIVATGGGSGAVHALLSHPGASRFVLEVQIPYHPVALATYLGDVPAQSCSAETARQLSQVAFERAASIAPRALGIACTAALQTTRERRGSDRAFICIQSARHSVMHRLEFNTDDRAEQEQELSAALLEHLATFIGEEPCKAD